MILTVVFGIMFLWGVVVSGLVMVGEFRSSNSDAVGRSLITVIFTIFAYGLFVLVSL